MFVCFCSFTWGLMEIVSPLELAPQWLFKELHTLLLAHRWQLSRSDVAPWLNHILSDLVLFVPAAAQPVRFSFYSFFNMCHSSSWGTILGPWCIQQLVVPSPGWASVEAGGGTWGRLSSELETWDAERVRRQACSQMAKQHLQEEEEQHLTRFTLPRSNNAWPEIPFKLHFKTSHHSDVCVLHSMGTVHNLSISSIFFLQEWYPRAGSGSPHRPGPGTRAHQDIETMHHLWA